MGGANMIYEYVLTIEGDYQTQIQCKASSFDEAWDIARAAAQAINAVVTQLWIAAVQVERG